MSELQIQTFINGREYQVEELDALYKERARYTLNEMHELGATILDRRFQELTTTQIAQLPQDDLAEILLANKLRLGPKRLDHLYWEKYLQADDIWREMVARSVPGGFSQKASHAHLIVTGLSWKKGLHLLKAALKTKKLLLAIEPDHIDASGVSVTETMGMYGKPTRMGGTLLNVPAPEPAEPSHYLRLLGASYLKNDPSVRNAIAYHQVQPLKGGLDILAAAYFPSAAPQELVDGHSLHLGVEMSNLFRYGMQQNDK